MFNTLVELINPEQVVYSEGTPEYNEDNKYKKRFLNLDTFNSDNFFQSLRATSAILADIVEHSEPLKNKFDEFYKNCSKERCINLVSNEEATMFLHINLYPTDYLMGWGSTHICIMLGYIEDGNKVFHNLFCGPVNDPVGGPRQTICYYKAFCNGLMQYGDKDSPKEKVEKADSYLAVDCSEHNDDSKYDFIEELRQLNDMKELGSDIPPKNPELTQDILEDWAADRCK